MTEQHLSQDQLQAFNDRMFSIMVRELATLPFTQLCDMHEQLVDRHEETAGSDQEPAVAFALSAMGAAIQQQQIKRQIN